MPRTTPTFRDPQRGGITILVVLMLLVLLTIAATAMSKNALREAIISGTSRQGAEARSIADSGLEWSILWLDDANTGAPDATAQSLKNLASQISDNPSLWGKAQSLSSAGPMVMDPNPDLTKQFNLQVMYMGSKRPEGTSSDPQTALSNTTASDLACWSVRSEGQLVYSGGGPTFFHRREVWFTALPKGALASH